MDTNRYRNEASIVIDCPAGDLYDLVADLSQMGRWSPVCTGGSYDDDGEWFTGTNAIGDSTWDTRCRVVVADRGREFTFINHGLEGRVEMVRWGFRFRPLDRASTEVTQSWEVQPAYPEGLGVDEDTATQVLDMMNQLARGQRWWRHRRSATRRGSCGQGISRLCTGVRGKPCGLRVR